MPFGQVNVVSESESKPLEVWVAEDSPFYRLVVEEAIEEIAKVTYLSISLTVFERFGDIRAAFNQAERGLRPLPSAVLSAGMCMLCQCLTCLVIWKAWSLLKALRSTARTLYSQRGFCAKTPQKP